MKDNIFTDEFTKVDKNQILSSLQNDGVYSFRNALSESFINNLLEDVKNNKFSINENWTSGVYTEKQYYVKHLLGCSKLFYSLSVSNNIFQICDSYFQKEYRLKAYRYYETFSNHPMEWHTDNKISKKADIPGIIFIFYLNEVNDGEFQFIKGSHKFSDTNAYNVYTNKQIDNEFSDKILSFKGNKGDIIIYDTYGIHRAKPFLNINFVRKSLFFQIDADLTSAEPSLVNPMFFKNLDKKTLNYFGFGLPAESTTYPVTNYKRLPARIYLKSIFFPFVYYKIPRIIFNLLPKKLKDLIKKRFKKNA
jgi:hypothetical protein